MSELRNRKITLRLDASEFAVLEAQAASANATLSEVIRGHLALAKTNAPSVAPDDAFLTPKAVEGAFRSCLPE